MKKTLIAAVALIALATPAFANQEDKACYSLMSISQ